MFPLEIRMFVYDCVINHLPTNNVPILMKKAAQRFILENNHLTLGFDGTTQEGIHLNSIHVTTRPSCYIIAVDELHGGSAGDYSKHICESVDHLARFHSEYTGNDSQSCRNTMICNISNCMTDRAAANHATICHVNEAWDKSLT